MLAMLMLLTIPTFAETLVTGTNGNTIYLSLSYLDVDGAPITSVQEGESFYVRVNFFGNPTRKDDSIWHMPCF